MVNNHGFLTKNHQKTIKKHKKTIKTNDLPRFSKTCRERLSGKVVGTFFVFVKWSATTFVDLLTLIAYPWKPW